MALTRIGLAGITVMGQNLALNIAEKGFPISVYNRTTSKVDETVQRAKLEGNLPLYGFHDPASFVNSIQKPRVVIMLVKAGAPVDQTITTHLEQGDCIVDGGTEWYENTERSEKVMDERGLLYLGMAVFGGEEGAHHGPSMIPGGSLEAYQYIKVILLKVSAQVPDNGWRVTYIWKGDSKTVSCSRFSPSGTRVSSSVSWSRSLLIYSASRMTRVKATWSTRSWTRPG